MKASEFMCVYVKGFDNTYDYEKEEDCTDDVTTADRWLLQGECDFVAVLDALSLEMLEFYTEEDL